MDYAPSQEVAERFPEIPKERFARAFQLILPDGEVLGGAEAVAALAGREAGRGPWLALYRRMPGAAPLASWRTGSSRATGPPPWPSRVSLWGSIRPAADVLRRLRALSSPARPLLSRGLRLALDPGRRARRRRTGSCRSRRSWTGCVPDRRRTLLAPSDALLDLAERRRPPPPVRGRNAARRFCSSPGSRPRGAPPPPGCSTSPLSVAGQTFLEFQWDFLLTETGLLAIFLAPPLRLRLRAGLSSPRLARFLLVWLLFRLMLSSGAVKLASGDAAWREPHGPPRSLRDAAAATVDRVVRAPAPGRVPDGLVRVSVLRRARCAVSLLRPAAPAPLRLRHDDPAAGPRRGHRQLRLLQSADDLARHPPSRRRRVPETLAGVCDGRCRERGSRSLAAMDSRAGRGRPSRRVRGAVSRFRGVAQRDPGRARRPSTARSRLSAAPTATASSRS